MRNVPLPPDEESRLELLTSLNLLDTAPEAVFDRITRLAARLLDVPTTLFSLVDGERQWFKSRVGLDVTETPREQAFCAHAILESVPLVVEDAALDARFSDNPLVTGVPHVRFYAGVQIRTREGNAIGTLCAIDSEPRTLKSEDLQTLQDLADIITKEVQFRERLVTAEERLFETGERARDSEDRFRAIFDLASIGIALVAPGGGWLTVNAALCAIVGYTERELLRLTFPDITYRDDMDADAVLLQRLQRREISQYQLEKRYVRKDGGVVWVNLNVSARIGPDGKVEHYVSVVKDIQAQKMAEQALQALNADLEKRVRARTHELQSTNGMLTSALLRQHRAEATLRAREAELRIVIENAGDAYICLDERGFVTAWNHAAELTFGWSAQEALDRDLADLIIPAEFAEAHRNGMARYLQTGSSAVLDTRLELPGRRKDGSTLLFEVRISGLEVNGKRLFSAFLHDISARKQIEALREHEARHDQLTGLGNRRALLENLPVAQKRAQRNGQSLALLFIDLDGFKAVNDTWGHETGDRLLTGVARRLNGAVRETDSVFRLAGDEFTVILENVRSAADAARIAHKLIGAISQTMEIDGASVQVGASIGVAMHAPQATASAAELIREADGRMYEAKQAGRGQVR